MREYNEQELKEQKEVIQRILETGTPEEVRRLWAAYDDSELHPAIRSLIEKTARELHLLDLVRDGIISSLDDEKRGKKKGTADLDVARAAKEVEADVQGALKIDKDWQEFQKRKK